VYLFLRKFSLQDSRGGSVASMSGRLLNRWGRTKKPQLLAKLERLERQGQFLLPGFDKGIQA
ncbi:Rha family transcriptional regulator, partial [Escherichia coli]|nr:Rha family transcriptional regulator [Escherichia coli]